MPIESVLQPILDIVLDAVVVMDRDGTIEAWNAHAEAIFGWQAADAIGRKVDIIIPPALREAHRRGLKRFNAEGVARVLDQRLELTGLRRDGSEFPIELSITRMAQEGGDMFVGFLRDITDRREAERQIDFQLRESRLLFELSELAGGEGDLEDAFVAALDAICELAGSEVGHALRVAEDGEALQSGVWSSDARKAAPQFVAATEDIVFKRGLGLPGRVLESAEPVWVPNVDKDDNFPRRGLGYRSAFAFPVFSGGRCIGVLEFFARDMRAPDPALLQSARAIGSQVARVYERKLGEDLRGLLLAEIDHRAKNILSMVRAVARLSFGSAQDIEEAQKAFDSRLDSIAGANAILRGGVGDSASLAAIVSSALTGCGSHQDRVAVIGPDLRLGSSSAIMMSIAVHELCTNAFKYGALSNDGGSVEVRWASSGEQSRFDFEWIERGGPPVDAPSKQGFGSRILVRGVELATGGKVTIGYEPDGVHYRLSSARHDGPPPSEAKAA